MIGKLCQLISFLLLFRSFSAVGEYTEERNQAIAFVDRLLHPSVIWLLWEREISVIFPP